jgi:hypothetical protein
VAEQTPQPSSANHLILVAAGSEVRLVDATKSDLITDLRAFFEDCHSYADVVGERPAQDELQRMWAEQEERGYALLSATGSADYSHPPLRDTEFTLLVGFDSERGAWPVLTRDDAGLMTLYIKCSGLEALRLSCQVSELVPGMERSADCDRPPVALPRQ